MAHHPAGMAYGRETVVRRLQQIGCDVYGQDELIITVPSWRSDLREPNDLAARESKKLPELEDPFWAEAAKYITTAPRSILGENAESHWPLVSYF